MAADKRDFEEFLVEDNMHIAINLKDFKAVVAHAETANSTVTARYTRPCKPLQLSYDFEGVNAEFTIMTRGEVEGETAPTSSRAGIPQLSQRQTPAPAPVPVSRSQIAHGATPSTEMPPPPPRARSIRPLNGSSTQEHLAPTIAADRPSASAASMEYDALFVPADDDRQWDEMNDEEEPQDILGWDASGRQVGGSGLVDGLVADINQDTSEAVLRDAEPGFPKMGEARRQASKEDDMGVPPTQRMSQVGSALPLRSDPTDPYRSAVLVSLTEMAA